MTDTCTSFFGFLDIASSRIHGGALLEPCAVGLVISEDSCFLPLRDAVGLLLTEVPLAVLGDSTGMVYEYFLVAGTGSLFDEIVLGGGVSRGGIVAGTRFGICLGPETVDGC